MVAAIGGAGVATAVVLDDRDSTPVAIAAAPSTSDDAADPGAEDTSAESDATAPEDSTEQDSAGQDSAADEAEGASEPAPAAISAPAPRAGIAVSETSMIVDCFGEDWQPSEEEIAEANKESEALVAVLEAAGLDHTVTTNHLGFMDVQWDYEDGIAQATVDSFYRARYPDEYLIEEIPAEELARMAEENAGLIEALEAAGVSYEVRSEEGGYEWVEFDYEDPAAQEVAESYYNELYPSEPLPAEEIERIREENAGLTAALDAAGITYEVQVDESGYEWVEFDYEDPEAQEVVEGYYSELYPVIEGGECEGDHEIEWEPTQEDIDRANAENQKLIEAFDEAGIDYTTETDDFGFVMVEWDWENPEVQEVLDSIWGAENKERSARIAADFDRLAAAFDAAGVSYELEGHDDCPTLIFDVEDPDALAAVASLG